MKNGRIGSRVLSQVSKRSMGPPRDVALPQTSKTKSTHFFKIESDFLHILMLRLAL